MNIRNTGPADPYPDEGHQHHTQPAAGRLEPYANLTHLAYIDITQGKGKAG